MSQIFLLVLKMVFIRSVFHGISQIFLQKNAVTGVLILAGVCAGNWLYGLALLVATIIGTVFAYGIKCKKEDIETGLLGFSAGLVGLAFIVFFQSTFFTWAMIIIDAMLASGLQAYFIHRKIPVFTLPFILVTWIGTIVLTYIYQVPRAIPFSSPFHVSTISLINTGLNGVGQVVFQEGLIGSSLIVLGLALSNVKQALLVVATAFIAGGGALLIGQPTDQVVAGIFGFNSVLSVLVCSAVLATNWKWMLGAIVVTLLIQILFIQFELFTFVGGYLTLPFVMVSVGMVYLHKKFLS